MWSVFTGFVALWCRWSGTCCSSEAEPVTPFLVENYLGVWYQIATTPLFAAIQERNLICTAANYSLNEDGTLRIDNSGYNVRTGEYEHAYGTATQVASDTGEFKVKIGGAPRAAPYVVLKLLTDNNGNYDVSLVWSCEYIGPLQTVWILARNRTISSQDYQAMYDHALSVGIPVDKLGLAPSIQVGCPSP